MSEGHTDLEFDTLLHELDRRASRIVVRLEMRRFRKPVTIVQGLPKAGHALLEVARSLKRRLATGGTAKDGLVLLQGDHRDRVRDELVNLGFAADTIEVQ